MLIVTGVIEIAEADVEMAMSAAIEMMHETRKEPGCLVYEFAQVLGTAGRFRVYEEWESAEALEAHFRMPHMARFRAVLGEVTILSRELHTVTGGTRAPL